MTDTVEARSDLIECIPFEPSLAGAFRDINLEWISSMFTVEAMDTVALDHPQREILDRGGRIWFARHAEHGVIGTLAMLRREGEIFELSKMGVSAKARGLKVGETLLQYALAEIEILGIELLFLLTNWKCEAAIHLYEKNHFVHDDEIMQRFGKLYERCNVAMRYTRIP